jgi:hypothetical protein
METPTPEAVCSYLQWRADEEKHDAEFLEECAHKFDAVREPFLRDARIYRERAKKYSGQPRRSVRNLANVARLCFADTWVRRGLFQLGQSILIAIPRSCYSS